VVSFNIPSSSCELISFNDVDFDKLPITASDNSCFTGSYIEMVAGKW